MRKRMIAAIATGAVIAMSPAAAQGAPRFNSASVLTPYEKRYEQVRDRYVDEFGVRSAGRDIVRDGYLEKDGNVREASRDEVDSSADKMKLALNPPAPATAATAAITTYTASASSTVACESGGDYTAVNPAGYYGAYQFDQQTWDAYAPSGYAGTNPASAPPAVQDAAAASVPYDAWPSC